MNKDCSECLYTNDCYEWFERTPNWCCCQILNLSYNRLKQIPDDWTLLYRLVELNVAGNYLQRLPKDVQKLRNLVSLDVSDNMIDQLPDKLAKLASLRRLNIADNVIMQWPANFVKLQAKVEVCGVPTTTPHHNRFTALFPGPPG